MKDKKRTKRERYTFGLALAGGIVGVGAILLASSFVAIPFAAVLSGSILVGAGAIATETVFSVKAAVRKANIVKAKQDAKKSLNKIRQLETDTSMDASKKKQALLKNYEKYIDSQLTLCKYTGHSFSSHPRQFSHGRARTYKSEVELRRKKVEISAILGKKDFLSSKPKGSKNFQTAQKKLAKEVKKYGDTPAYSFSWVEQVGDKMAAGTTVTGVNKIYCQNKGTADKFKNLAQTFSKQYDSGFGSILRVKYSDERFNPTKVQFSDVQKLDEVMNIVLDEANTIGTYNPDIFPITVEYFGRTSKNNIVDKKKNVIVHTYNNATELAEGLAGNYPEPITPKAKKTTKQPTTNEFSID